MYKVLIPEDVSEVGKNYLLERGYELEIGVPTDEESLRKAVQDVDALLVRNARYPKSVLEAGRKLKVVARHGTGVDNIDVDAATKLGIQVTNAPVSNINTVAEYTCALILALSCQIKTSDAKTRECDWSFRSQMPGIRKDLGSSTVGIIGYGRVGSALAEKLMNGFGVRVVAYNLVPITATHELLRVVDSIDEVLESSDFVSIHVPSTPETRKMCDYDFFKKMKPDSYFINCARGDVYVENDLAKALHDGVIRGAAVDVYETEPLGSDSPLLKLDNIILSQHNSSLSKESTDNMALHAAMGIDEVLTGKKVTWPVNKL